MVKNSLANAGDRRHVGLGRSPGGGHGNSLLQYSCLNNLMDRGSWRATVHRASKSWTQLKPASDFVQYLKLYKVKVKVTQSCPTLCDPMDYIVHGILQARILEWVAFPFSRGTSQPHNQTRASCIAGGFFTN